jgi:2',3'-cyclic-nucleotide 2'-phosphodiesterase (5'-nucleotidase family)
MPYIFKRIILSFFIIITISSCKKEKYVVTKIKANTIAIDSSLRSDQSVTSAIAPFKEKMIKEINTVISYTPKNLVRTDGTLESSLGNLLADLSYKRANPLFKKLKGRDIDFAMFNYGGIRAGINKGKVTNKHAFELMPFENMYVVVELSGNKIEELVQYLIKSNTAHPLSSHISLTINNNNYQLKINGKAFDKNKSYFVLTTDYLQSGGDNMNFFKNPIQRISLEYKMRDGIVDYFKSVDTLTSKLDGRFKRK